MKKKNNKCLVTMSTYYTGNTECENENDGYES